MKNPTRLTVYAIYVYIIYVFIYLTVILNFEASFNAFIYIYFRFHFLTIYDF